MANVRPSSPPPRLRTTRGEAPLLERGTCCLPAFTPLPPRFFRLSLYEVPELEVLQRATAGQDPRRGNSEQRGSFTLPVTGRAIVRPRLSGPYGSPGAPPVFPGQRGFQSPSAPCRLATTSAPACSARVIEVCVPSMPRPGLAPGFPRSAPRVHPRDPFQVAQHLALGPPRYVECGRAGGCAPTRRVWCCTSPHFRRHAAHPAEGRGGGPYSFTSGPGANREVGHQWF